MCSFRSSLALIACFIPTASVIADEKTDEQSAALIVGEWAIVRGIKSKEPAWFEFKKDGSVLFSMQNNGVKNGVLEGKYVLKKKIMILTLKIGNKDEAQELTLKSLTADKFEFTSSNGIEFELVKIPINKKP